MHLEKRAPRGNALMLTLIAISVLMMLVVGAIQFTNHNRVAAAEKLRGDTVSSCADAARRHLLSRLRLFRMSGELRMMETRLIDDPEPSKRTRMMTGHLGTEAQATVVDVAAETMGAASRQVRDIANAAPSSTTLGGQYYRVVVNCKEASGRESEVEFLFRYGL